MPNTIRVRAVDGTVVFAIDPATGRIASPLRAIGRDGPSLLSAAREFEDVPEHPVILRALASKDLELLPPPAEASAKSDAGAEASDNRAADSSATADKELA